MVLRKTLTHKIDLIGEKLDVGDEGEVSDIFQSSLIAMVRVDSTLHWIYLKVMRKSSGWGVG